MQFVTCLMITAVILLDFIRVEFGAPPSVMLLPELLSGIALLFCASGFARNGIVLQSKYLVLFLILLVSTALGLIIAEATVGPVVGGMRIYLRWIPFFLLPLFYPFTEKQLRVQMMLILLLMLSQAPLSFLQRFVFYAGFSGDEARGTFSSGSQGAIVALSTIAVVVSLFQKRVLGGLAAIAATGILFLPSTVGEVKGAFVLMPFAIWIPILLLPNKTALHSRHAVLAAILTVGALVSFSVIYSLAESTHLRSLAGKDHRTNILDLLTNPDAILNYLAPRSSGDVNANRYGRVDGVTIAIKELNQEPMKLISGLGMGAVTNAPFSFFASDQHKGLRIAGKAKVTLSVLIWELGLLGTGLVLAGLALLWFDALKLRYWEGLYGALGLAWTVVIPIFVLAMLWKNTLINNPVMFLFALFTGHMLAGVRLQHESQVGVEKTDDPESESMGFPSILSEPRPPALLNAR